MNELDYRVAIEALENHVAQTRPIYETSKAIDYLKKAHKEALAQPEQEEKLHPVHIGVDVTKEGTAVTAFYRKPDDVMEMFYSQFHPLAQPEQERCVGCEACIDTACGRDECPKGWPKAAQPEQEPVAWRELCRRLYVELFHCNAQMTYGSRPKWKAGKEVLDVLADAKTALDETPPQRTWVGLTDEEIMDMYNEPRSDAEMIAFGREVEAKLKEKNNA